MMVITGDGTPPIEASSTAITSGNASDTGALPSIHQVVTSSAASNTLFGYSNPTSPFPGWQHPSPNNYTFTLPPEGWWNTLFGGGAIKQVANFIADLVSQGLAWAFHIVITIAVDFTNPAWLVTPIAKRMGVSFSQAYSNVFLRLLPFLCLAVAIYMVWHYLRGHNTKILTALFTTTAMAGLLFAFFTHFSAIFQIVNNLSENLDNTVSEAIESVADLSASTIYDAAWDIYVLEPWELAQFGHESNDLAKFNVSSASVGQSYTTDSGDSATIQPGDNWVVLFMKNTTAQARDSLLNDILNTSQPFAQSSWTSTSVKNANPYNNIIFLLVMFVLGLPCLVFLAFMAFMLFGLELAFLFSAFMGIFVLPLGFVPEIGWWMVQKWVKKSLGFLLLKLANVIYMAITFLLVTIVMDSVSLTGDEATLITGAITSGLIFLGALMMRHQLFYIFVQPIVARVENAISSNGDEKQASLADEWRRRAREAWNRRWDSQGRQDDDDNSNNHGGSGSLVQKTLSAAFSTAYRGGGTGGHGTPFSGNANSTTSSRWTSSGGQNSGGSGNPGSATGGASMSGASSTPSFPAPSSSSSVRRDDDDTQEPTLKLQPNLLKNDRDDHAAQGSLVMSKTNISEPSVQSGASQLSDEPVATVEEEANVPETENADVAEKAQASDGDVAVSDPLKDEVAETTGTRSESGEEDGTPSSVQDSALQRKGEPLRRQPEEDLAVAALADAFATPDFASRAGVSSARRRTTDESGEEPDVAEYQTETTREGAREEDVPSQQLVSEAFVAPEPESRSSEHRDIDEWRVENSPVAQDGSRESDIPDSKARREETPAVERSAERPDEAYDEAGALARSFDTPAPTQAEAAQASHRAISETATDPMADEVHTVTMDEAHAHEAAPASQVNATHMKIGDPRADVGSHTEVPARVNDAEKTNEAKADATLSSGFSRTSEPVASDPVSVPSATIRRSEVPHDAERDQDESLAPAQSPSRQHKPGPVIRLQPKEQSKSVQASKTSAGKRDRQDENRRIPPSVSSRPTQHPRQRARMGQPLRFDPRRNRNPRDNA